MGAFNDWVRGTYLESYEQREAADVAEHIMQGAAYLYRVQSLRMQGLQLPVELEQYVPHSRKHHAELGAALPV
jgi:trans-AT polyketide synthase, acyltransferase and oxidoreductase domains